MYYQFPQSSLSSIKPAYDGKQSITFSDNNQSNSQATKMNHQWQKAVLNILDEQRVSLFDLLQFTLRTHLPIHSHHRERQGLKPKTFSTSLWTSSSLSGIVCCLTGIMDPRE